MAKASLHLYREYEYRRRLRKKIPKPTTFDIFRASIKSISKEYCEESSIGGLKHLVDDTTPLFERIIWIIILIVSLGFSVSLVWTTFAEFYTAPLVLTQIPEGIPIDDILFPAIGFCTNNRISKKAVEVLAQKLLQEERNKHYSKSEMMSLLKGLGQLYGLNAVNYVDVSAIQLHEALGTYNVHGMMRNLTPKCEEMLLRCAWNNKPTNCSELFDFRLTANGYCCTFNYLRFYDTVFRNITVSKRSIDMYKYGNKSSFDVEHGLKVLLRFNESDDFFYNLPIQGVQLQFSDAYDFPDSPSGSYGIKIVTQNVKTTVIVSAGFTEASRDIQHVAIKLRQCRFYDESNYLPFYTYSDCMLKCRMYFLLQRCNCTPFYMLKLYYAKTCNMHDVPCLRKHLSQSISIRPNDVPVVAKELELDLAGGGIHCPMCNPTCSKTAYSYYVNHIDLFPEELNKRPDDDRDEWLHGVNFTGTSIVHVKYGRDVADSYGQNVIMKWFDLISIIGSTCGVITGFSFVSILEFIYFFTIKLYREVKSRRRQVNKGTKVVVESKKPSQLAPVGRYRPIYWNELTGSHLFPYSKSPIHIKI